MGALKQSKCRENVVDRKIVAAKGALTKYSRIVGIRQLASVQFRHIKCSSNSDSDTAGKNRISRHNGPNHAELTTVIFLLISQAIDNNFIIQLKRKHGRN